jgi:hypothetical protein
VTLGVPKKAQSPCFHGSSATAVDLPCRFGLPSAKVSALLKVLFSAL